MSKFKNILMVIAGMGLPLFTQAQATKQASFYEQYQLEIVLGIAVIVCLVALLSLVTALYAITSILNVKNAAAAAAEGKQPVGFWQNLWAKMNDAVPVEEEETILTDHAYDGIRELDNRLPPWWLYGFYLTIVFGVIYMFYYHMSGGGPLSAEEYEQEMAKAKMEVEAFLVSQGNLIDENSVVLLEDADQIELGKQAYMANCKVCHGDLGQGVNGLGPNFTDKYWLHGGDIQSIFKTIKYGVPNKGMQSWEKTLGPKEIQQVASFIYSLEGTNPPNAREPQGELFERAGSAPAQEDVSDTTAVQAEI